MNNVNHLRMRYVFAVMMAAVLGYGSPTSAADGPPDFVVTFPAGLACSYFDLQIEGWNGKQHVKEFKDKNGNVVRVPSAGTGSALRYTNVSTGQTFSSKSNGAVTHTTYNAAGTSTLKLTGHNLVILFPTDTPAGPSTTLYDGGRVVIAIDVNGNFTVQEESGNKTNICAAVSQ
jgi:hypothetical protein